MEPLQILVAFMLLGVHSIIIVFLFYIKKEKVLTPKTRSNLIAIYSIYLIVLLGFAIDIFAWNFLTPEVWAEKMLTVWLSPIDNFSAVFVAILVRSIFGEIKEI